jgi:hypothetical protein
MTCRICLDDAGSFISPCLCTGTMKDVHEACLIEWLRTKDNLLCELCHVPIMIEFNQDLERSAYLRGFHLEILTNPAIHILIHCLVMIFFCSSDHFTHIMINRFIKFQLGYNGMCILLLYFRVHKMVYNKQQYLYYLLSFPYVFLLLGTIGMWIVLIETPDTPSKIVLSSEQKMEASTNMTKFIIISIVNQSTMGLYPILHNHILDLINKHRYPTFKCIQAYNPEIAPS